LGKRKKKSWTQENKGNVIQTVNVTFGWGKPREGLSEYQKSARPSKKTEKKTGRRTREREKRGGLLLEVLRKNSGCCKS